MLVCGWTGRRQEQRTAAAAAAGSDMIALLRRGAIFVWLFFANHGLSHGPHEGLGGPEPHGQRNAAHRGAAETKIARHEIAACSKVKRLSG